MFEYFFLIKFDLYNFGHLKIHFFISLLLNTEPSLFLTSFNQISASPIEKKQHFF